MNYKRACLAVALVLTIAGCNGKGSSILPSVSSNHGQRAGALTVATPSVVQTAVGAAYAPASVTVKFSSAPAPGDVLLVFFYNNATTSGTANTYTATGWTQLDIDTAHSGYGYEAFYHVVASGDGSSYVFTPACQCRENVWIAGEYSGVSTTAPIDRHGFAFEPAGTATFTTPSVTPSQASDLAVTTMMPLAGGMTWTNAAGWTTDLASTKTWSVETLHQAQTGTTAVSEASTGSPASSYGGYAAIALLTPSGAAPTPTPTPTPTPGGSSYAATVEADSPTAYYRLDDTGSTAADSSGNGLSGTIGSGVTKSAAGLLTGDTDTAMHFPGVRNATGVVSVARNTLLEPANAVTLEAWIRFTATPPYYTVPVGYGNDSVNAPYEFFFTYGGKLSASWTLSSGFTSVTSSSALQTNTTYHIVSTYDGTNERLYINGALAASGTATGTLANYQAGYGLAIGDDYAFTDDAFNGTVDEVAVYAGKALTATQVLNHYKAGSSGTAPTPSPVPNYSDWTGFGDSLQRTGYNANEKTLTQSNVAANGLKVAWTTTLGGSITAQPVLATNVSINGTPTNVLYVGAENNVFYAVNADTGAIIWQNNTFGAPEQPGCGDLPGGTFGITGTATYDKNAGIVYVADASDNVHALSMTTGVEQWRTNVLYDPNTATTVGAPNQDHIYSAVTLNPGLGVLYVSTASFCDNAPWHGRVVAVNTTTHNVTAAFFPGRTGNGQTGTSYCGAGIWGMGGASIDPNTNDVLEASGNVEDSATSSGCIVDPSGETYPYGDAVVELDQNLNLLSFQTATANGVKAQNDSDYGATPMIYTASGCGVEQTSTKNKNGYIYTYGESSSLTAEQQIQVAPTTSSGQFVGVPAFDPTTGMVFVGNPAAVGNFSHGLNAFSTSGCSGLTLAWKASIGSANATAQDNEAPTVANGIVFFEDGLDNQLWAFNDSNGAVLWHSGTSIGSPCASYGTTCGLFGAPLVDARVYVGSWNHNLYAFSL